MAEKQQSLWRPERRTEMWGKDAKRQKVFGSCDVQRTLPNAWRS